MNEVLLEFLPDLSVRQGRNRRQELAVAQLTLSYIVRVEPFVLILLHIIGFIVLRFKCLLLGPLLTPQRKIIHFGAVEKARTVSVEFLTAVPLIVLEFVVVHVVVDVSHQPLHLSLVLLVDVSEELLL